MSRSTHPKCRPPRGAYGVNACGPRLFGSCGLVAGHIARHEATPKRNAAKLWRLGDDGRWREDNGRPGVAFVGAIFTDGDGDTEPDEIQHVVWIAACKCHDAKCPRWKALEYAREKLDIESISVHERPRAK